MHDRPAAIASLSDRQLLERYHRHREPAVREVLVERFLPLARHLARRYQQRGEPLDDLLQVASVGLLKAIDRFEPGRKSAFSSFAVPTILGELRRYFRDTGWAVNVPRDLQERAMRVERVAEDLTPALGRAPSTREIADAVGITVEEVLEALQAAGAHHAFSLDGPSDDSDDAAGFEATVAADEAGYERAEAAATIAPLMHRLSHREREILRLRFEEDLTQSAIAARVGLSQMHVSRLIRSAIARLSRDSESA